MTKNDCRIRNINAVFGLFSLLQVLQVPTVFVESLSIQSRALRQSPFSTPKTSPLPPTRCPSERISTLRTTTPRSKPTLFAPLYTISDDTIGTSNKTIESSDNSNEEDRNTNIDDAESSSDVVLLPSYKQLIVFTATTILIWLSEPLLSLVDTTIVGLTASAKSAVVQIAALGPATTLFDSLIYTTYFLAISTTNQLAPGLAAAAAVSSKSSSTNEKQTNPWKDLRQSTSHLLGLAIVFGSMVTAITFLFGKSIIGQMVGGASSMGVAEANAIIPLSNNYARIRAAVAPFSILGFVAQSVSFVNLTVIAQRVRRFSFFSPYLIF